MRIRWNMWNLAMLSLGACLLAATASNAATIVNGSFEQGPTLAPGQKIQNLAAGSTDLPGWTIIGTSIDFIGPDKWPASDGNNSLDLNGLGPGGVQQVLSTTPGTTYEIGFDLSGNPGQETELLRILEVSAAGQSQQFDFDASTNSFQDMGWVSRIFTFTANAAQTTLTFATFAPANPSNNWGPALDNVQVLTPEPTTGMMLGLGLAGLARRRRRS